MKTTIVNVSNRLYRYWRRRPESVGVISIFVGLCLFNFSHVLWVQYRNVFTFVALVCLMDFFAILTVLFGGVSIVLAMLVSPPK